jgi:hypothetical protein
MLPLGAEKKFAATGRPEFGHFSIMTRGGSH